MLGIENVWDSLDPLNQHNLFLALKTPFMIKLVDETITHTKHNLAHLNALDPKFVEHYRVVQTVLLQWETFGNFLHNLEDPMPGLLEYISRQER